MATVNGWQIHDERGRCTASTAFDGDMIVMLDFNYGDNIVLFTVTNPAWESIQEGQEYPVTLHFSNGQEYPSTQAQGVRVDNASVRLTGVNLRLHANDFLGDFAGAARVQMRMDHQRLTTLNLSGTRAVAQRLITCAIASWRRYPPDPFRGRGSQSQGTAPFSAPARVVPPQRARANLNNYFSVEDYPAAALRENSQGTTGFRLTIGPNGRVSDCSVTSSSGSAALDAATCRILNARARYTPARDSNGNPTTGTDSGRVTWRLPVEAPATEQVPIATQPSP